MNLDHLYNARGREAKGLYGRRTKYDISFIYGFPHSDCMPSDLILQATARALNERGESPLQYGGQPANFVQTLIDKLARDQHIKAAPENILVLAGSSSVIAAMTDVFVERGDTIVVEAPTFLGAVHTFKTAGARIESVSLDENGIRTDELEATLRRMRAEGRQPKFIYVIPNFQNPAGVTLSLERRKKLIELAREYNTLILEDDAYFDLRFRGAALPTIYELAGGNGVVYLGTFSKILAPGIRVGWAVADPELVGKIDAIRVDGAAPLNMHLADEFCKNEGLQKNIAKLRQQYGLRAETMVDALSEYMPDGVTWTNPDGGFFVWVTLPATVDSEKLVQKTRERGVDILPGRACYANGDGARNVRLAFSYAPIDKIPHGIKVIADCIRELAA